MLPSISILSFHNVNNYIDWDQYNTLYDEEFLEKGRRKADELDRALA